MVPHEIVIYYFIIGLKGAQMCFQQKTKFCSKTIDAEYLEYTVISAFPYPLQPQLPLKNLERWDHDKAVLN